MRHQAIALRRQNDLAGTETLLREVLSADANNYDALHLLGVLEFENGRGETAARLIAAAIRVNSGEAAAHYNLGNALRLLERHAEAIASYERAIALKSNHWRAHNNGANCLADLHRHAEAVASYDRAIAIEPAWADTWHNRGKALVELKRFEEAIESFRRALAHGGDAGRLEFELAALRAAPAPVAAPEGFITSLFDRYADTFDKHLVGQLGYRTPGATVDAVRRMTTATELDVLDLGCGTGLCGPLLKPFARTLVGVDLSKKMLDKARQLNTYDELVNANVTNFLLTKVSAFDLVIATDLFIYIGDLTSIFAGAARALRVGGHFAFSVEHSNGADFVLQASRRYAQSEHYLRRLADAYGFAVKSIEPCFIRKDGDADISGMIAVMQRLQAPDGDTGAYA